MIYRLEIENFYSVRDRQVIDLSVDRKVPDEPGRLVAMHEGAKMRVPRVVAFFGANASGKSNIMRAIVFLSWFVRGSFEHQVRALLPYQKFRTVAQDAASTRLSVTFAGPENPLEKGRCRTCPYAYVVEFAPRDGTGDKILRESLHYRPGKSSRSVRIFERNASGQVHAAPWLGLDLSVLGGFLRPDASVISTLGHLKTPLALRMIRIANAINTNISPMGLGGDDPDLLARYAREPGLFRALNRDIRRMGMGIDRVELRTESGAPAASFWHSVIDRPIPLQLESGGTRQFFRIYPTLHRALALGGIALVDDLDQVVHPAVSQEICAGSRTLIATNTGRSSG